MDASAPRFFFPTSPDPPSATTGILFFALSEWRTPCEEAREAFGDSFLPALWPTPRGKLRCQSGSPKRRNRGELWTNDFGDIDFLDTTVRRELSTFLVEMVD